MSNTADRCNIDQSHDYPETKAVARWDWDYKGVYESDTGDYVALADHERVVGELREHIRLSAIAALELDAQNRKDLAASRTEVEELREAMILKDNGYVP